MTTPARPGSFTGATDNAASGGLFTDTLIDGIPDIIGVDVDRAETAATNAEASATTATTQATSATASAATATTQATAASTDAAAHIGSRKQLLLLIVSVTMHSRMVTTSNKRYSCMLTTSWWPKTEATN